MTRAIKLLVCNTGDADALLETMGVRTAGGALEVMSEHVLPAGSDGEVIVYPDVYLRCGPVPPRRPRGHATDRPAVELRDPTETKL